MEFTHNQLNNHEINAQIENKIGSFVLAKCENELQNNDEYAEMQEDLSEAYLCNDIEKYKNTFDAIMELRKTIFYKISAKYICYLLD